LTDAKPFVDLCHFSPVPASEKVKQRLLYLFALEIVDRAELAHPIFPFAIEVPKGDDPFVASLQEPVAEAFALRCIQSIFPLMTLRLHSGPIFSPLNETVPEKGRLKTEHVANICERE